MMQTDGKLIFDLQITVPSFSPTMSPLFSQMSPLFQEPWDIVPSYEISRQNTDTTYFLNTEGAPDGWTYIQT